jgi:hypothetical protein
MVVHITLAAAVATNLAQELRRAVETEGRSLVEMSAWMEAPPRQVRLDTMHTRPPLRLLCDSAALE